MGGAGVVSMIDLSQFSLTEIFPNGVPYQLRATHILLLASPIN